MSDQQRDLAARIAGLSPEKRALLAKRVQRPAGDAVMSSPIAIIGMGCRFPGADGLDAFWSLLRDGRDAITEVPADRWDANAIYHPDPSQVGRVVTRWGGFITEVDRFDAGFFGISPREAARMDPQQRVLLEVAWDAFEHAGQTLEGLAGSETGVFIGVHSHSSDYAWLQDEQPDAVDSYTAIGTAHSVLAGRLSYLLDLKGPSLAIDTACSASLVAVHYACQSLRTGESKLAVAGGVNLMLTPDFTMATSRMHVLSGDGRCKPFDAAANGFVRSEGAGVVVLKRLADALVDGDRVLAVIRGSAVNQDGQTNGIAAPNGLSQQDVVRKALERAGISPGDVSYVEAHGTGTPLGDPIEVEALAEVLGPASDGQSCALGSAKANIGHLEGAAGIAGVIKTVLSMQHREIPPIVHYRSLNPHIDALQTRFVFPTAAQRWDARGRRIAGVSSFGYSGTNAHVILEEPPAPPAREVAVKDGPFLLPLSARSAPALTGLVASWTSWLDTPAMRPALAELATTASHRRSHHPYRTAVVARTIDELRDQLRGWAAPDWPTETGADLTGGTVFVFPGQGSQRLGMGAGLMSHEAFAGAIERAAHAVAGEVDWSLLDVVTGRCDARSLERIDVAQPSLFAVEVALAALWQSWGITPDVVVGHSMGEIAAAAISGALTIEDAARVICRRSRLLGRLSGQGAMAVVDLPPQSIPEAIAAVSDRVAVAAYNGPHSSVIAGDPAAIDAVVASLSQRDVFCRRVNVDIASHSPQMDPLLPDLTAALTDLRPSAPHIRFLSTVDAEAVNVRLDGAYWARNLRQPVKFAGAIRQLLGEGHTRFVEVSPHPLLVTPLLEVVEEHQSQLAQESRRRVVAVPSLHRDHPDVDALLGLAGALYTHGATLDWSGMLKAGVPADLPSYPWQRERHWLESGASVRPRAATDTARWLYELEWQPRPTNGGGVSTSSLSSSSTWAVLNATGEIAQEFIELVSALTQRAVVNLDAAPAWQGGPLSGVIDFGAMTETGDASARADRVLNGFHNYNGRGGSRFWVVTSGAQAPGPGPGIVRVDADQAAVWGLGRVISLEAPETWGGLIDLDPAAGPRENAEMLWHALTTRDDEDQVVLRSGTGFVPRVVPSTRALPSAQAFHAGGTYVITGGLGRLGRAIARWMAERGAGHLVLVSRTGLTPERADGQPLSETAERRDLVRELEQRGTKVTVLTADVADAAAMRDAFENFGRTWPALRGIVHAAGVIESAPIRDLSRTAFRSSMRAKFDGARVLDALSRAHALDFFVMFSSGAGVWGSAESGAYAAANAALDALAHRRRLEGQPAVAVDWGWWAGGNTAALDALFANTGLRPMPMRSALDLLGRLLVAGPTQQIVVDVDWTAFRAIYEARRRRPMFDAVATSPVRPSVQPASVAAATAPLDWSGVPSDQRRARLTSIVRDAVAETLGLSSTASIDLDRGFFKLGMDSLMTVRLRGRVETRVGCDLPSTVAFEYPTVRALSGYLFDRLGGSQPSAKAAVAVVQEDLARASEDDLARMLDDAIAEVHDAVEGR